MRFLIGILTIVLMNFSSPVWAQYHAPQPIRCHAQMKDEAGCLACAIFNESKSEPLSGQLAVGFATMNRVKSKEFSESLCKVIWKPGQYQMGSYTPRNLAQWAQAVRVSAEIIRLSRRDDYARWDFTGGSTFFHATSVNPGWRYQRTIRHHGHVFYGLKNEVRHDQTKMCVRILNTDIGVCDPK